MVNQILNFIGKITDSRRVVAEDIMLLKFTIVNACIIGNKADLLQHWVLVDTGLKTSKDFIIESVEKQLGVGSKPKAIILTHGHFDHVGSVIELANLWNIPVYAHKLELPYLTGEKDYPKGDPTVDSGLVAKMSPDFPHHSIDLADRIYPLPRDFSVPFLPGWRYIHTPGHTEGHISLYREKDEVLLAGDAITTVKQESLTSVLTQKEEINGPPKYLTANFGKAFESIRKIKDLNPKIIITSHGNPLKGNSLTKHLNLLILNYKDLALEEQSDFV